MYWSRQTCSEQKRRYSYQNNVVRILVCVHVIALLNESKKTVASVALFVFQLLSKTKGVSIQFIH